MQKYKLFYNVGNTKDKEQEKLVRKQKHRSRLQNIQSLELVGKLIRKFYSDDDDNSPYLTKKSILELVDRGAKKKDQ